MYVVTAPSGGEELLLAGRRAAVDLVARRARDRSPVERDLVRVRAARASYFPSAPAGSRRTRRRRADAVEVARPAVRGSRRSSPRP